MNKEKMKVYVLTVDDCEDKQIVGVFTSLEKLNEFKEKFPTERGYNDPIEWELDKIPERSDNEFIYYVMYNNQDEISTFKCDFSSVHDVGILYPKGPTVHVLALNEEDAIKKGYDIFKDNGLLR